MSVKVFGQDYDVLEHAAKQAKAILEKQPGTANVELETAGRPKSIVVELDQGAMLRLGLGTAEVNAAITDAVAGAEIGFIPEGEARHMIVVRMPESLRANPSARRVQSRSATSAPATANRSSRAMRRWRSCCTG